ncbi:MAG: hypothetical protein ACOZAR_00630 [Patescibacteria group bacterium]
MSDNSWRLEAEVDKNISFWRRKLDVLIMDLQKEKSDLARRMDYYFFDKFDSKLDWQETVAHFSVCLSLLEKMREENCVEEIKSNMQQKWMMGQDLFAQSEGREKIVGGLMGRIEEWLEFYPWHPSRPLKELPKSIRDYYVDMAQYLLDNLNSQRLEVELVPAPEPKFDSHKIRFVRQSNPEWYREIYHGNNNVRRDRSCLALRRISKMADVAYDSYGHNDTLYRQLIHEMLINGCQVQDVIFESNKIVRRYFMIDDFVDDEDEVLMEKNIEEDNKFDCEKHILSTSSDQNDFDLYEEDVPF